MLSEVVNMNTAMASSKQNDRLLIRTKDDDVFWHAVQARDARFDGRLFFAVRSTGIYCRPSCPARRPRREQVVFFQIPEAAEQAGFRSCRRCRPHAAATTDPQINMVRQACSYIEDHSGATPTL